MKQPSDYHTGGIIQLDPSPDNPVGSGDLVAFFAPSNLAQDSTDLSARIGTGSTSEVKDRDGTRLQANDLVRGTLYTVLNDSTGWIIESLPLGSGLSADEQTKFDGIETGATADQTGTEIVDLLEALTGDDQLSYDSLSDLPADSSEDDSGEGRERILDGAAIAWAASNAAAGDAATTVLRFDRALTEADDGKLFSISMRFEDDDAPADSRFAFPDIDAKFIRALTATSARSIWPGGGLPVASGSTPVQFLSLRFWTSSGFASAIWNLYYSGHLVGLLSSTAALGSTTLTVTSTTGLSAEDYIYLNSERIQITSVDSETQLTVPATTAAHTANSRLFLDDGRGFFFTQTHASQDGAADVEIDLVGGGAEATTNPRFNEVASAEVTTDGTTNWLWADTGIAKDGDNGWDQAAAVFQIELEQHSGVANEAGRSFVTTGLIRKSEFNAFAAPDENNGVLPASANADDDAERYNVHMRETQSGGGLDLVIGRRDNGNIIIAGESGGHTYTVRVLSLEGGGALEEGQQSPEGVSSLTAGYVHTLFYRYATSEPSVHAANWRFDDEWSNTDGPPSDGWYDTAAEAFTTAALNPSFVEADNTLWECRGRFRRRLNNDGDAYVYSDSKEVFAVFGEQFSEDGESWHGTQTDDDIWQRIRTDLGDWGTPTYIGIPGGTDWEILRTFINAYRTGDEHSVANVSMSTDLTEYSELRFRMYGLSSGVTARAPIIENVIQRPESGWPVDNDDASTFNNHGAFQWRYGAVANIFNIGLMGTMQPGLTSHVTQEVVDPSDINNVWTVTIQAGGRFKFYSSSNSESDVDNLIVFDQPGSYQRVRIEVSGR